MAYEKLVVCGSDYAVGYQTINKAKENVDSQFEAFKLQHGVEELLGRGGFGRPPVTSVREVGHHNDERIPRDSVRVTQRTSGGFVLVDVTASRTIVSGARSSAGKYAFQIRGLSEFWGMAVAEGNGVSVINTSCKSVYPTGGSPFLLVDTYLGTSPADATFTLTLYGNP